MSAPVPAMQNIELCATCLSPNLEFKGGYVYFDIHTRQLVPVLDAATAYCCGCDREVFAIVTLLTSDEHWPPGTPLPTDRLRIVASGPDVKGSEFQALVGFNDDYGPQFKPLTEADNLAKAVSPEAEPNAISYLASKGYVVRCMLAPAE